MLNLEMVLEAARIIHVPDCLPESYAMMLELVPSFDGETWRGQAEALNVTSAALDLALIYILLDSGLRWDERAAQWVDDTEDVDGIAAWM